MIAARFLARWKAPALASYEAVFLVEGRNLVERFFGLRMLLGRYDE
jgi:hypothetical protein